MTFLAEERSLELPRVNMVVGAVAVVVVVAVVMVVVGGGGWQCLL